MILIVDFGSQTAHLIQRHIQRMGVETDLVSPEEVKTFLKKEKPAGLILSGGPASVYQTGSPTLDPIILNSDIPVLGICYGWQLLAKILGGRVEAGQREFGPTQLTIHHSDDIFAQVEQPKIQVWMSHGDEVVALPDNFIQLASTKRVKYAAVKASQQPIFGLQFHPEVSHTQFGARILRNFVEKICHQSVTSSRLDVSIIVDQVKQELEEVDGRLIAAVSGGVDSTVASAIVAKAVGRKFTPIYCDNGLMRHGTKDRVEHIFRDLIGVKPRIINSKSQFLQVLKGVTDPEKKRKIIGHEYINCFEKEAKKIKNVKYLVQGTIYSDVIESQGSKKSSKIKSHHNVGGLPSKMSLKLLEPLKSFYKDEVRQLAQQLGFPEEVVYQQPFPGPGQAIRILGEVTAKRLAKQHQADQILLEVMKETDWYHRVFQCFPVLTGVKTTAVKGDGRVYAEMVGLRIYTSSDIMTAGWARLPYAVLQKISTRIVNEVPDVSRVVYDITTKPPATMEWE